MYLKSAGQIVIQDSNRDVVTIDNSTTLIPSYTYAPTASVFTGTSANASRSGFTVISFASASFNTMPSSGS